MNAPWTGMGVPAITIRVPGPGLPVGLQLVAPRHQEPALLAAACHIEELWQNEPHD
jgi:Asp-tRNA(Asn)/Glu-tRNA(Gln) amidotransferase A subunit family amidase